MSVDEDREMFAECIPELERHKAAQHAMQSGVAFLIGHYQARGSIPKDCLAKAIRVGVNTALSDHSALARLLIRKGLISAKEYAETIAAAMEEEKAQYEKRISDITGKEVKLG